MGTEPKIFYARDERDLFIILIGRITAVHAYSLLERIKRGTSLFQDIWVDLSRTEYVDSTTIGTLLHLHQKMEAKSGSLFLCNVSPEVHKILKSMHLDNYLHTIRNSNIEALDELAMQRVSFVSGSSVPETFVLDVHHDLCSLVPELNERFKTLFAVLHQQVEKKNKTGN